MVGNYRRKSSRTQGLQNPVDVQVRYTTLETEIENDDIAALSCAGCLLYKPKVAMKVHFPFIRCTCILFPPDSGHRTKSTYT